MQTTTPRDTLETERNAYNAAFSELGLDWFWDAPTYMALRNQARETCHVRSYLEAERPHLLRAYDAEFLVQAIETRRAQLSRSAAN